jgi:hypothetical protein
MLTTRIRDDAIAIGPHRAVSFQRTLRIPDDDGVYPLPPGLGRLPLRRLRGLGIALPLYRREAMWISFGGAWWRPSAVKIAVGGVNVISGEPLDAQIRPGRQDYVVCPDQPWLDGINAGDGFIRQFVAVPLGDGLTVEGQLTGAEHRGGLQIVVIEPRPGLFPDEPPRPATRWLASEAAPSCPSPMGLGAGGRMRQEIVPDAYGWETWDPARVGRAEAHLLTSADWRALTGEEPPPTPIDARTYPEAGLPWFDLYSERGDLPASERLAGVRSVDDLEGGAGAQPTSVPPWQVAILGADDAAPVP